MTTVASITVPQMSAARRWAALAALLGATFCGTINNSLMNVAVPFVAHDLQVPITTSVWAVTAFSLGLATMMPLAGRLGDIYGQRRLFFAGAVLFAGASLIVGMSSNIFVTIVGRLLQGVGGSPVLPCILATIARIFPESQRSQAVGMWAAVNAAALAAGPSLGGVIVDTFGWRALFLYFSTPAMIIIGGIAYVLVPPDPPARSDNADVKGALLLAVTLGLWFVPITEGTVWGWANPLTIGLFSAGVITTWLLIRHLQREPQPFVTKEVLQAPGFTLVTGIAGLQMTALFAVTFTVPVFYVVGFGENASTAGLITSALPVSMLIGALLFGRFGGNVPFGTLSMAGGFGILIGAGLIALFAPNTFAVVLGMVSTGLGISLIQSPSATEVTRTAPEGQTGVAAGVFNASRFMAGSFGATAAALAFQAASGTGSEVVGAGVEGAGIGVVAASRGLWAGIGVATVAGIAVLVCSQRYRKMTIS